jgi:glycosyltransferase involved in cell wall biosynthesis
MHKDNYIIITPAKNEAKYLSKTIESVVNQTIKPIIWVIVDDGSTDSTSEIVKSYQKRFPFIKLVNRASEEKRNFGNKVYAIQRGFEEVKDIDYRFYCNLDADISFETNYFEELLTQFEKNAKLGICGGKLFDLVNGEFLEQSYENHSVGGPVQFFRRECYERFKGYQPFKGGFIDGHAEISARMHGWETQTFPILKVKHYRPAGTAKGSRLKMRYEGGKFEYRFGYSYLYHFIRTLGTFKYKPYIIGGIYGLAGYLSCAVKGEPKLVDKDFVSFVRNEQYARLNSKLNSMFRKR